MDQDPLKFDIRITADRRRRAQRSRRGLSGAVETSRQICAHPGCGKPGLYRAPRAPDALDDYLWFCRDHVREYNLRWNFFAGMEDTALAENLARLKGFERSGDIFARRNASPGWLRFGIADPLELLGERGTRRLPAGTRALRLLPNERKALEILAAEPNWTKSEIRKRYRTLVKDLHPDTNGGSRADEARLQQVLWAWEQIRASRNFKE